MTETLGEVLEKHTYTLTQTNTNTHTHTCTYTQNTYHNINNGITDIEDKRDYETRSGNDKPAKFPGRWGNQRKQKK